MKRLLSFCLLAFFLSAAPWLTGTTSAQSPRKVSYSLSAEDNAFLEDLSRRSFQYFWEQADPGTGLVRDRARINGNAVNEIASTAATGFGLTALSIAAERKWITREDAKNRVRTTLMFSG